MVQSPRRAHLFQIAIAGLADDWYVQKVTMPEANISMLEYGAGDHNVKIPSKGSFSNVTIEKLCSTDETDTFAATWYAECLALPAAASAKTITFKELGNDGVSVVRKWLWSDCFITKYKLNDSDRMGDSLRTETIEFTVGNMELVPAITVKRP